MTDARLKKIFHFTDSDLLANRQGRLSANQHKRFEQQARAEQKSARDSAVILIVIALGGLGFGLILGLNAPTLAARILLLGVLGGVWTCAWGWRAWKIVWEARRLSKPKQVRATRGSGQVIRHEAMEYFLRVGDIQFDVEADPALNMLHGSACAVYYLEETEEILSMEIL